MKDWVVLSLLGLGAIFAVLPLFLPEVLGLMLQLLLGLYVLGALYFHKKKFVITDIDWVALVVFVASGVAAFVIPDPVLARICIYVMLYNSIWFGISLLLHVPEQRRDKKMLDDAIEKFRQVKASMTMTAADKKRERDLIIQECVAAATAQAFQHFEQTQEQKLSERSKKDQEKIDNRMRVFEEEKRKMLERQLIILKNERDSAIKEKNSMKVERDKAFEEKDVMKVERDAAIAERNQVLQEVERYSIEEQRLKGEVEELLQREEKLQKEMEAANEAFDAKAKEQEALELQLAQAKAAYQEAQEKAVTAEELEALKEEKERWERKCQEAELAMEKTMEEHQCKITQVQDLELKLQKGNKAIKEVKSKNLALIKANEKLLSENKDIQAKKKELEWVEAQIKLTEDAKNFFQTKQDIVFDGAIRKLFERGIKEATEEIAILSPFVAEWALFRYRKHNASVAELLHQAMKRGVTVKIVYGVPPKTSSDRSSLEIAEKLIKRLRNQCQDVIGLLHTRYGGSHDKVLIIDKKYMLSGSFNLLSFAGDYERRQASGEKMDVVGDEDKLETNYRKYFRNM